MRRILVALDESENSMRAVKYVADMFGQAKDVEVTLLHIYPEHPVTVVEDLMRTHWEQDREKIVAATFKKAARLLLKAGLPEKNIKEERVPKKVGIARDILAKAKAKKADTLILGRRGLSPAKEFFIGSVSHKIVHNAKDCAVFLIQ